MPRIYRISKFGTRILQKIRHRRGHGIHSPFVFSLITKVIEEKRAYYAYTDIPEYIQPFPEIKKASLKNNRLIFRLTNYFNSKNILEIGAGDGQTTLYASAYANDIIYNCIEISQHKYEKATNLYSKWNRRIFLHTEKLPILKKKQDCIIVCLKNYNADFELFSDYILHLCHEKSFIIIKDIRTKRRNQVLWRKLKSLGIVTVSIDLFNIGILFFDKKLYKRNYRLNF